MDVSKGEPTTKSETPEIDLDAKGGPTLAQFMTAAARARDEDRMTFISGGKHWIGAVVPVDVAVALEPSPPVPEPEHVGVWVDWGDKGRHRLPASAQIIYTKDEPEPDVVLAGGKRLPISEWVTSQQPVTEPPPAADLP
jgi:hypothetical protein